MPQSLNVTAKETSQIPEHTAETAAASRDKKTHLSGHEETVENAEHRHNEKLNHGHEAALEAAKDKK